MGKILRGDNDIMPLGLITNGEKVEIIDFAKTGKSLFSHLRDMGILVGKLVEVISNERKGPILLKVDGARIAIGKGMSMKILVRRLI